MNALSFLESSPPVNPAHQAAGIGLEQPIADHDDAKGKEQEPVILTRHHHN